jgi:hypothetical protein
MGYQGRPAGWPDPRFTIIIVDAVRPYAYEINNILALPPGFGYRCRYRQRRVRVDHPAERLAGTHGLVILRSFEDGRLFPVRKIHVDKARKVGDIVYIQYTLRDWVKLSSSQEERQRQIDHFNELVSPNLAEPNEPGADLHHLVFFGIDFCYFLDESSDEPCTADERWGNIVDELRRLPIYHQYDFLKVVALLNEHQQEAPIVDDIGFQLRPAGTYELEMLQRRHALASEDGGPAPNRLIRLLLNERDYRPIEDTFSVGGRYDLFRYRFHTMSDRARKHSFMLLRNEPTTYSREPDREPEPAAGSASRVLGPIPDILIPTVIDPTHGQMAVIGARVLLGVLLFIVYVAPQLVTQVATANRALRIPIGDTAISQMGLVLLVLVLAGSFDRFLTALTARLH